MVFFFVNIIWSLLAGKKAPDNPWGEGATTLEWTLSSPPPFHQFETLPVIDDDRARRPLGQPSNRRRLPEGARTPLTGSERATGA